MKVLVKFICRYLFHCGVDFSFILHALNYKCDDRTRFVEPVRDAKAKVSKPSMPGKNTCSTSLPESSEICKILQIAIIFQKIDIKFRTFSPVSSPVAANLEHAVTYGIDDVSRLPVSVSFNYLNLAKPKAELPRNKLVFVSQD